MQLLREVASRSTSFFQAASSLQVLQQQLSECVGCIRGLREELADADQQLYSTAATVKGLQARRENLQDTLDITKVRFGVVCSVCFGGEGGYVSCLEVRLYAHVFCECGNGVWLCRWCLCMSVCF